MKRIRNDVGKKFLREDVQSFFDISIRSRILYSRYSHFLYGGRN